MPLNKLPNKQASARRSRVMADRRNSALWENEEKGKGKFQEDSSTFMIPDYCGLKKK